MKFNISLIVSILFFFKGYSQTTGFTTIKDELASKTNFASASQKIESIESQFNQVKNLSMLKDKIVSKGKFYYKKGNKVRIEYTTPYQYLMVLNNNTMMIKDDQKTSNYNTKSNKMMQSINNIMLDCMRGSVYNNKEFSVQAFESPKEYLLKMKPQTSIMKKMFANIEVFLDKKDFHVLRLNMIENGGDNSLMSFSNTVMNKNVADALFNTK